MDSTKEEQGVEEQQAFQLTGAGRLLDVCYSTLNDRVATCSTAGEVQVWAAAENGWRQLHSCKVPGGPRKLAWAEPDYAAVLAIGTQAGQVVVLQGPSPGVPEWRLSAGRLQCGRGPICDLKFAPKEVGLLLAAASSDGHVYMHEGHDLAANPLTWTLQCKLKAMRAPCECVCWRPFTVGMPPMLLACHDDGAAVWCYQQASMSWKRAAILALESDESAAQALHWAPTLGRPMELVAVSFGVLVAIFSLKGSPSAPDVALVATLRHPREVWKLEFNHLGNTLACSLEAPPEVWCWMPELREGSWQAVGRIVGTQADRAMVTTFDRGMGDDMVD